MARHKAFDQEDVLDKAVAVFWAKGYEATSMQDLVDAMGIQRGSLYATFGSKQQLFLQSLERYGKVVVKQFLDILQSKPSGVESIELFFDQKWHKDYLSECPSRQQGLAWKLLHSL
jgi:TetR/AcrR family transcriptional repressor of nem operon